MPEKQTPLFAAHQRLGARLTEFGGWTMPVQYSGIVDEHKTVRTAAGLFDISHMGEFFVRGSNARAFLDETLSNDVSKLGIGQGQYTLMLDEQGGVIDDLILYRVAQDDYFLVVNAGKIDEDAKHLTGYLPAGREFRGCEQPLCRAGVAGTEGTGDRAHFLWTGLAGAEAERDHALFVELPGDPDRTDGLHGEDGLELFFAPEIAENFFNALLEAGAPLGLKPCGLGARDTLRLEACLPLNGNDLSLAHSALAAGLEPFLGFKKETIYPGRIS